MKYTLVIFRDLLSMQINRVQDANKDANKKVQDANKDANKQAKIEVFQPHFMTILGLKAFKLILYALFYRYNT